MRLLQNNRVSHCAQRGFSLVEMMIAVVLGLFLIGGAITIFSGGVKSSEFNQSLTNLQANARYVLDVLTYDVRMAGFQGCTSASESPMKISTNDVSFTNFNNAAISGALIESGGWSPAKPTGFTEPTAYGKPVVGTQALVVQYASSPGYTLSSDMANESADLTVVNAEATDRFNVNDLAVISDCSGADLFTVKSVTGTTTLSIEPEQSLSKSYVRSSAADRTVRVMPYISSIYYVGETQRENESGDDIYSLFRQNYPFDAVNNPPVELVEAVDQLQLEFGVTGGTGNVTYMLADDAAYDAASVTSVRIGVLVSSIEGATESDDTRVFRLANQIIEPYSSTATAGTLQYPKDNRLRLPYTTTVSVRNR